MDDEELNDGILPDNDEIDEEDEESLSKVGFHKENEFGGFDEPEAA